MSTSSSQMEEILRSLQTQNELLLQLVRRMQERDRPPAPASPRIVDLLGTPPLRPLAGPSTDALNLSGWPSPRHMTNPAMTRPSITSEPKHVPASIHSDHSGDLYFDDQGITPLPLLDYSSGTSAGPRPLDAVPSVQKTLPRELFTDEALLDFLARAEFPENSGPAIALHDFLKRRQGQDLDWAEGSFRRLGQYENEGYSYSTCEVYAIGRDGYAKNVVYAGPGQVTTTTTVTETDDSEMELAVDAATVWDIIRSVNQVDFQAAGRITIVQEPTALMLGSLHLVMRMHFDMDEILTLLVSNQDNRGHTTALMNRNYIVDDAKRPPNNPTTSKPTSISNSPRSPSTPPPQPIPRPPLACGTHLRQRSFIFVFRYYTVVNPNRKPALWERFDDRPADKRGQDHINIAECSSVLALSLTGDPISAERVRGRRGRPPGRSLIFDTFAPWHLLNIQSFPDDEHTVRSKSAGRRFCNGPYAFLDALVIEYRDAAKRNMVLHEKITKLITPNAQFMFEVKIRDKLLFEDKHFTYIRRYFWAYMTLGVINHGLRAMCTAYETTFTPAFWTGRHTSLWPHPAPDSAAGISYRETLAPARVELEAAVAALRVIHTRNEETRREIENLREQLFSGSSIMESRRAIDQGDNIRILTLASMIFLPLTFVTSVFGITEFNIPPSDFRFPLTMVCVCVPFLILLILLQTRTANKAIHSLRDSLAASFDRYRETRALKQSSESQGKTLSHGHQHHHHGDHPQTGSKTKEKDKENIFHGRRFRRKRGLDANPLSAINSSTSAQPYAQTWIPPFPARPSDPSDSKHLDSHLGLMSSPAGPVSVTERASIVAWISETWAPLVRRRGGSAGVNGEERV